MPTSPVQICNVALRKLREQPIASLQEDSEPARLCGEIYNDARDYLLAKHPHNFAMRRKQLNQLADAPAFEFRFQYSLPTDPYCLRAYRLWHGGRFVEQWQVEAFNGTRVILADYDNDVYLLYVARITDVSMYAPTFVESLSDYIAWQLAYALSRDKAHVDQWEKRFDRSWREHKVADGGEGFLPQPEMGVFTAIRE